MRTTLLPLFLAAAGVALPAHAAPQRKTFTAAGRYLTVEALRDDLLHFETAAGTADASKPIYTTPMVAKTDYPGAREYAADATKVETADLRATVDANLCVALFDKTRGVALSTICPVDLEQAWKGLTVNAPRTKNAYGLGQYFAEESPDGDWLGRVWDPLSDGFGARLRGFAGGANDYSMFPILYALGDGKESWALFVDQLYKQMWDFKQTPWKVGMWGDQIRFYVLAGPDLPDLRRDYMELTGRPPVPPKRSFGLWVSEFGFLDWNEVHQSLQSLRDKRFPIDGFALDLQWFGGTFGDPDHSRMGTLTFDERKFPDPAGEIRRLHDEEGVNLMPIEEPYVSSLLQEHTALAARGYLARQCEACPPTFLDANPWWGKGGMVDFTSLEAGDFWHDFRRQKLYDLGITDHWADLGEPEQYDARSWYFGFPELGKHGHADVHNIYGSRWMESIARGYRRNGNTKRPFLLSRTGTSGIQRHGVAVWSGDIGTNWGNLRSQMNVQMHMSLSGVDYYGSDVGGFQRQRGQIPGGTEQLYTQWLAAAAALDVPVRPHAWNLDKQRPTAPSLRGDEPSNRENLRLRYRLAPYYYSLAFRANRTGDPVFPPLVHWFQDDPNVRRLGGEKLIGKDLLVALVAQADATTQSVYLPRGEWADFHTGEWLTSAGQRFDDRPLYPDGLLRLPLFARAGAIVPMQLVDDETMNIRGKRRDGSAATGLTVRVFASGEATAFDLSEDDGESYGYEQGKVAVTRLEQRRTGETATVTIHATQGSYDGMPAQREYTVELYAKDREAAGVTLDGAALGVCGESGAAPCYTNADQGRIVVKTPELPQATDKTFVVTLRATAPRAPWLYLVCRNGQTSAGTAVYAVGSTPQLGSWDAKNAVKLVPTGYPTWSGKVAAPAGASVEWKCLKRKDDGTIVEWQGGANNQARAAATGYAGASEGRF